MLRMAKVLAQELAFIDGKEALQGEALISAL
jgi:hypothetical protein